MSDRQALSSFIDKWRARWPEWRIAEVFIPRHERERVLAWFALGQELTDAAWGGSDPLPGQAKLAWWAEELDGWAQGRRRHPLGWALQQQPVPWSVLAESLPSLRASREHLGNTEQAIVALEPFAQAVAAILVGLHDRASQPSARDICTGLLAERLLVHGDTAVPAHLQPTARNATVSRAAAGQAAANQAAANQAAANQAAACQDAGEQDLARISAELLLQAWPPSSDDSGAIGIRADRIHLALLRARLRAFASGSAATKPLPSWRTLSTAWRAARGHAASGHAASGHAAGGNAANGRATRG